MTHTCHDIYNINTSSWRWFWISTIFYSYEQREDYTHKKSYLWFELVSTLLFSCNNLYFCVCIYDWTCSIIIDRLQSYNHTSSTLGVVEVKKDLRKAAPVKCMFDIKISLTEWVFGDH